MYIVYSEKYDLNLDPHPWHTSKYRHTLDILKRNDLVSESQILQAPIAEDSDILRVHSFQYYTKLSNLDFSEEEIKHAEIPLTHEVVDLFRRMTGGTVLASEQALEEGICVHLGGGFHHAYPSHASGFCLLNDIAISLNALLYQGAIRSAAVIDCDLHQGDGTARIFQENPQVCTLSIHQKDAFPSFKQCSSIDVELSSGTGDDEYLTALDKALAALFAEDRGFDFIHYQSGVDSYFGDLLGRFRMSEQGLRERDRRVISTALEKRIPMVITLGGGYTVHPEEVAQLHANTVIEAILAEQHILRRD
jgi:acetoin utilization deacetylase AcuC-like enzyme